MYAGRFMSGGGTKMNWIDFIIWAIITLGIVLGGIVASRWFGRGVFYGLYAGLTVVANIIAVKLITIGSFVVPAAVLVYSATFLVTDIIDEVWGRKEGYRVVMTGFITNIVAVIAIWLAVHWQAAPFVSEDFTKSFSSVLSMAPRIVGASVVSYLISQNHDVWAFHFWKDKTGGKYLWLRNNASTIVSQAIDTIVFIGLAFYGVVPTDVLFDMILGQYVVKVLIALTDTPFVYLGVWVTRKVYDI